LAFTTFAKAGSPPVTPTRRTLNMATLQNQTDKKEIQKQKMKSGFAASHLFVLYKCDKVVHNYYTHNLTRYINNFRFVFLHSLLTYKIPFYANYSILLCI
jgi:hypothetical protein